MKSIGLVFLLSGVLLAGGQPLSAAKSCGDLDQSGSLGEPDALALRRHLARFEMLDLIAAGLCDVVDDAASGGVSGDPARRCTMADVVVLQRGAAGSGPAAAPLCALGSQQACNVVHAGVGCSEASIALCVCATAVTCCTDAWTESCANLAIGAPCNAVKLIAIGDTGEGNPDQFAVADAMNQHCADVGGCTAVILAGDNFYDDGVQSTSDPQWVTKFEDPYNLPQLDIPFYAVFGNHDYGLLSLGVAQAQIDYTSLPVGIGPGMRPSARWNMPASFYGVSSPGGIVDLFFFDTQGTAPMPSIATQIGIVPTQVAASTATWKVAVAHHPRFTAGAHQDDNVLLNLITTFPTPPFQAAYNPPGMYALQEAIYCGTDMFLSGHDHGRQLIDRGRDANCPDTFFAVSGAGSKVTASTFPPEPGQLYYDDTIEGFAYLSFTQTAMQFAFHEKDGSEVYSLLVLR